MSKNKSIKQSICKFLFKDLSLFSVSGRIGRLRYLTLVTAWIAVLFLPELLFGLLNASLVSVFLFTAFSISAVINILFLCIKRVKDFQPPKWAFLVIFGSVFSLPILLFTRGTEKENIYGEPDQYSNRGLWLILLLMVICILSRLSKTYFI